MWSRCLSLLYFRETYTNLRKLWEKFRRQHKEFSVIRVGINYFHINFNREKLIAESFILNLLSFIPFVQYVVCFLCTILIKLIPFAYPVQTLTFWRRNFFLMLAHPVYKMWITQEWNTLELWNKLHFEEEKKRRVYTMFKIFCTYICWINI